MPECQNSDEQFIPLTGQKFPEFTPATDALKALTLPDHGIYKKNKRPTNQGCDVLQEKVLTEILTVYTQMDQLFTTFTVRWDAIRIRPRKTRMLQQTHADGEQNWCIIMRMADTSSGEILAVLMSI